MGQVTIYDENIEWVFSTGAGTLTSADGTNPHTGVIDLFANHALPGDSGTFTAPAPINSATLVSLSLWIDPTSWSASSALALFWEDGAGNQLGNSVLVQTGNYGFNNASNVYQNVVIPIADFAVPAGSLVRKLAIVAQPKTNMSFFLDTVVLTVMAISCTPSALEAAAACFECLTPKQAEIVATYVIAQIGLNAGAVSTSDPKALLKLAAQACFTCLTGPQLKAIQDYVLCSLVNK